VLTNRVRKAALRSPEFAAKVDAQHNLNEAIEKIIAKHKASGVINDKNYAEVKARNLRLSGKSQRRISDVLTSKGLDSDDIKNAILSANEGEDGAKVELEAARRLAKRRRLGVYRTRALPPNQDKRDVERRDFASLARAGFSFDVARKVLRYIPTA
jgi:regulatory protein